MSVSQEVNQSPSTLLGKPEEKIQLSSSHNIPDYYTILWYQRSVGDTALTLIAYSTSQHLYEHLKASPRSGDWGSTAKLLQLERLTKSEPHQVLLVSCAA